VTQLNLHSGGTLVTYDELRAVPTPLATATHVPLPHHELVELVRYTLGFYGHSITEEHFALDHDGARFFAVMCLESQYGNYSDMVGLRNSSDKSFPIGVAFGSKVFVCSNLAFASEHVIRRKHTVNARRELPALLSDIIRPLQGHRVAQNQKLLTYQKTPISDMAADHAILSMYKTGVIGLQRIAQVIDAYEKPPHDWGDRTAWRLFNAATYALTGRVAEKPDLTKRLHQVIDATCTEVH
jgi:hypothetical protein